MNSLFCESRELKNKREFRAIDIAKMICALMVVSIHIDVFGSGNSSDTFDLLEIMVSGWFPRVAVPFFFMSSGFFVFRKIPYESFEMTRVWKYVSRLLVLYLFWSVIYFPLEMKELALETMNIREATISYIYHFFLIGSYTHLWYLPALIIAILLLSFCIYKKIRMKHILFISGILYLIGVLGNSWYGLTVLVSRYFSFKYHFFDGILRLFGTTRNGLFFAFLFVTLGAFCAYKQINTSMIMSGVLFFIFYGLMLVEILILYYLDFPRGREMTFSLVPTVYFMFLFVSQIRINKDNVIYKKLRFCSSVTYFSHMALWAIILKLISITGVLSEDNRYMYWMVVISCVVVTVIMDFLCRYKCFKWLKNIF